MNKLFTKIAAATLGVAMAIGVGVAVSHSGVAKEARAADVKETLNYNDDDVSGIGASGGGTGGTVTRAPIKVDFSSVNGNTSYVQVYGKSTITISKSGSTNVLIKKVVMTGTSSTYIRSWTATSGTASVTVSDSTATWDYSTGISSLVLTNGSGSQARITKFEITYSTVSVEPEISFSPASLSLRTGQSASTVQATASNIGTGIEYLWGIKTGEDADVVSLSGDETATVSVTPLKVGSTILECYAKGSTGDVTGYVNVSVSLAPTSVTFNDTDPASSSYTLGTYDSYSYKAMPAVTVAPEGVSQEVTYTITSGSDLVSLNDNKTRINVIKKVSSTETATIKIASVVDESVFATLTVSVSHDVIAGIRVKPDTSIPTQYIGTTFNTNGIQFQKKHTNNTSWVNFESGDSVFSETEITSETTSARVYLTGSDKTIYCDVTGFTVSDYSGTYNIVSTRTTYTADVTAEQLKQYTDNSANFSFVPSGIRLGCNPGSGEVGKTSDIVLQNSSASLQIIAPTGFIISRIQVSVSAKSGTQTMTIGGYEWDGITKDKRSVLTEYPFTNSDTLSATNWMYIEYINITLVNSSNASAVALAYGLSFNELTADECEAMTGISDDTWGYVKDYFDAAVSANSGAEALIKGGQANKTGDDLGQALYRYDMIVAKYSKTDFLSRTGGSSGANRVQGTNSSANIAIIIVVSSVSLISLGALLAFKKKKEQ